MHNLILVHYFYSISINYTNEKLSCIILIKSINKGSYHKKKIKKKVLIEIGLTKLLSLKKD